MHRLSSKLKSDKKSKEPPPPSYYFHGQDEADLETTSAAVATQTTPQGYAFATTHVVQGPPEKGEKKALPAYGDGHDIPGHSIPAGYHLTAQTSSLSHFPHPQPEATSSHHASEFHDIPEYSPTIEYHPTTQGPQLSHSRHQLAATSSAYASDVQSPVESPEE